MTPPPSAFGKMLLFIDSQTEHQVVATTHLANASKPC